MRLLLAYVVTLVALLGPSIAVSETVKISDLVKRNGLYYKKLTDVPFTGKVTGSEQGSFRQGKREGPWFKYHPNGQLDGKVIFKGGKPDGPFVAYHKNGQLRVRGQFKNGKPQGTIVSYYANGQLKSRYQILNKGFHGISVGYYGNGQLKVRGGYKDSRKEGIWVAYYADGTLWCRGSFTKDRIDGPWEFYEKKKTPSLSGYCAVGVLHKGSGIYRDGKKLSK